MGYYTPPADYTIPEKETSSVTLTISGDVRTDLTSRLEVVSYDASELSLNDGSEG